MKENLQLRTKVKVTNSADLSKYEEVELIIDTGAAFSVIRKDRLQRLGIPSNWKKEIKISKW